MSAFRLGDVLEVQSGFAFKTEYFSLGEGIPLIRIRDLENSSTVINYRGKYRDDFIVEAGDYLIGMDGSFHCYRWRGGKALLNQRVCRLRNFKEVVDPEYIHYGIQKKLTEIEDTTSFVTVKHISAKQIQNIELPLLPIAKQRLIVDILSRAEGIVRLRREAEEKAAEFIPALFLDMFGDPATNPKGWPIAPFGDLVENKDGQRKPIKSSDRDNRQGPYPYYGASGIIDTYDDYLFEGEHLLIAEDGANLLSRSTPIAFLATGKYWVNNHAHVVAANGKANLTFLECLLNLRDLKDSITGSAQPKLNQANLNGISILNCPFSLQEKFAGQVEQIRAIQSQQSAATAKAQATFDALLAQVFSNNKGSWKWNR